MPGLYSQPAVDTFLSNVLMGISGEGYRKEDSSCYSLRCSLRTHKGTSWVSGITSYLSRDLTYTDALTRTYQTLVWLSFMHFTKLLMICLPEGESSVILKYVR